LHENALKKVTFFCKISLLWKHRVHRSKAISSARVV